MNKNVFVTNQREALRPVPDVAMSNVAVSNSVVDLADEVTVNKGTWACLVSVDGAAVRATFDGSTDPAAGGAGHLLEDGFRDVLHVETVRAMKVIRNAAVDAALQVTQLAR